MLEILIKFKNIYILEKFQKIYKLMIHGCLMRLNLEQLNCAAGKELGLVCLIEL